ncbi:MAG: hypothetical protein RJB26_1813 [Pseudomonadota bacterium]|jgi:hypothetical protein
MKIQVQLEIKPGSHAQAGTAQRLLEQVAIAIGSGGVDGTHTHRSADGKTTFGEAKYTVEPAAPAKA